MTMTKYSKYLRIPIDIIPYVTNDKYGDIVYGDSISTKCYVEDKINVVKNREGIEVVSNSVYYIDGDQPIGYLDIIKFNGVEYPIQNISDIRNKFGISLLKMVYV